MDKYKNVLGGVVYSYHFQHKINVYKENCVVV